MKTGGARSAQSLSRDRRFRSCCSTASLQWVPGSILRCIRTVLARTKEKAPRFPEGPSIYSRRRPTLPHGLPCSTIGAGGLNFSVRNGKRCDPSAIATGNPAGARQSAPFCFPEYLDEGKGEHRTSIVRSSLTDD